MLAKSLEWVGSGLEDLRALPPAIRTKMGYALWVAQRGGKHPDAKPLRGFGSAGVLEARSDVDLIKAPLEWAQQLHAEREEAGKE